VRRYGTKGLNDLWFFIYNLGKRPLMTRILKNVTYRYSLPMPNQLIPYKNYMKFWNNMAIIGGRIIHVINYDNNFNLDCYLHFDSAIFYSLSAR